MRTNLFNFKHLKKNNIVLEEKNIDSPFLLFFKRYGKYLLLLLMLLAIISLVIGLYFTIKNLDESTKIATNISSVVVEFHETDEFNSVNMKPITGGQADKIFYKRYGNIGLTEGVILVVKEVKSRNGLITYYSDGSAKIETNGGTITRISSLENNSYGIKENGAIVLGAKTKEIKVVDTKKLSDGTKIIYYSDNSASIMFPSKEEELLARNGDRIIIENDRLKEIEPSGVTKIEKEDKVSSIKLTYYEDGTIKVEQSDKTYIVRNEEDIKIEKNTVTFPNNNEATILREESLHDGSRIIYYTDGSAEIKKDRDSIMVRKSKDIVYNENGVIEIVETRQVSEASKNETTDNKETTYFNNGGALIKNPDNTYQYTDENSNIKFDEEGNIKEIIKVIDSTSHKTTPNGTMVIDFENGVSIIIYGDHYRVVNTKDIVYDVDGNIIKILGDEDDTSDIEGSVSENRFVINNVSGNTIKYMITIEVTDNYRQYASKWLEPRFLRYNIVENSNYIENQSFGKQLEIGTQLEGNITIDKETYILYEEVLENGEEANINLGIWLDYEDITNEYQDSVFAGTIKVYCETIEETIEK